MHAYIVHAYILLQRPPALSPAYVTHQRSIQRMRIELDGELASPPHGAVVRKAPGTDLFDFGQTLPLRCYPAPYQPISFFLPNRLSPFLAPPPQHPVPISLPSMFYPLSSLLLPSLPSPPAVRCYMAIAHCSWYTALSLLPIALFYVGYSRPAADFSSSGGRNAHGGPRYVPINQDSWAPVLPRGHLWHLRFHSSWGD